MLKTTNQLLPISFFFFFSSVNENEGMSLAYISVTFYRHIISSEWGNETSHKIKLQDLLLFFVLNHHKVLYAYAPLKFLQ